MELSLIIKYVRFFVVLVVSGAFCSCIQQQEVVKVEEKHFEIGSIIEYRESAFVVIGFSYFDKYYSEEKKTDDLIVVPVENFILNNTDEDSRLFVKKENAQLLKEIFDGSSLQDYFFYYLKPGRIIEEYYLFNNPEYPNYSTCSTASIVSIDTNASKIKLLVVDNYKNKTYFKEFSEQEFLKGFFHGEISEFSRQEFLNESSETPTRILTKDREDEVSLADDYRG
jgi:hypothetical protein